jgi:hypothetical protein
MASTLRYRTGVWSAHSGRTETLSAHSGITGIWLAYSGTVSEKYIWRLLRNRLLTTQIKRDVCKVILQNWSYANYSMKILKSEYFPTGASSPLFHDRNSIVDEKKQYSISPSWVAKQTHSDVNFHSWPLYTTEIWWQKVNVAVQVARAEIFDKLEPKPQKIRIILITVYR